MLDDLAAILRQAGRILLDRRASGAFTFQRTGASVHASVDIEVHDFLARALSGLSAGVPVLSEEDAGSQRDPRPEKYWLIDPLDGTASFIEGYTGFVTQAALIRGRRPILAGVHAPALDETFLAEAGAGALHNGLRCGVTVRREEQWTMTDNYPTPQGVAADLMHVLRVTRYLECGSIGLKICRVADGTADIFVKDVTIRDWDVAAPQLVLEEAGGTLRDATGDQFPYVGAFEHRGLIACVSPDAARRIARWLNKREES
jgi:3'(2'), 5'-bisphosphate nucleotidase